MNVLNVFTKAYSLLHNYPRMPIWILTPLRKIVRNGANKYLPKYLERSYTSNPKSEKEVIVSFTSFPARIDNVWQVVECMMRQTYLPSKIILWLSKDQFLLDDSIPQTLRKREGNLFEIRMVEGDIRSHKKYYYLFKEYPGSLVFLIDDDIYYPTDILERSIKEFSKGESSVICNYGYLIKTKDGKVSPYKDWKRNYHYSVAPNLFFGSGGGTLIDTSKLHPISTNIELARELTPMADDIWLNAVVRFSRMKISMLKNGSILPIANKDNIRLATNNLWNGQNDKQLKNVIHYFQEKKEVDIFANRS